MYLRLTWQTGSLKSSNDSRRTKQDDKLESNRRSFTIRPAVSVKLDHPPETPEPRRLPLEPPGSVPIVVKSGTSKRTKSMVNSPFSPPPRSSFEWWPAIESGDEHVKTSGKPKDTNEKRASIFRWLHQSTPQGSQKPPDAPSGKKQYKRPEHIRQRENLRRRQKREELRLQKERQDAQERAEFERLKAQLREEFRSQTSPAS
jgi:transcription initiation factor TFIID subunit 1, fungi type